MTLKDLVKKIYGREDLKDKLVVFQEQGQAFYDRDYLDEILETHGDREIYDYGRYNEEVLVFTMKKEEE